MSEDKPLPVEKQTALGGARVITMVRWLLYLIFVVIGFVILRRLAPVLTPILVAAGIAYLLDPLVDRLVARGMRRLVAVAVLLGSFLGSITLAVLLITPIVAKDVSEFAYDLPQMLGNAVRWVSDSFGYDVPTSWQAYLESDQVTGVLKQIAGPASSFAVAALGGFFSLLGFLAEFLLIPVFAFYFLLDWDPMTQRVRAMIPPRHRAQVVDIVVEIDSVVSSWIRGQLTVVFILTILYAAAFFAVGVPMAISVGVLVGLLTIIPFVGTFMGAGITVVLLLLDWQGVSQLLWVGGIFIALHLLEAAALTPKIVGKKVGLGEAGALFAVLAGGQLLGFTGVLLAVPLAASVAVLIRRLVRYYEHSAFFGAADQDESVKPDEAEVLAQLAREIPALRMVVPTATLGEVPGSPAAGDGDSSDDSEDS